MYEAVGKTAPAPIYDTDVAGVDVLDVSWRGIKSLAGLETFTGLAALDCCGNELVSLSALPSGLTVLACNWNQLTSLPALPSSLTALWCDDNQLISLPPLPSGLVELDCSDNWLSGVDVTGLSLWEFDCSYNNLSTSSDVKGFTGVWGSYGFIFYPQNAVSGPSLAGLSSWAESEDGWLNERNVIPDLI